MLDESLFSIFSSPICMRRPNQNFNAVEFNRPQKLFVNLSDKVHNSAKIFVFLADPARRSFPPHSLL